jgi:hemerythrin-like metal-binding protein
MPDSSDKLPGDEGARTVDDEHSVQIELIEALEKAIASGQASDEVAEILGRFREFTRLHFLSEELLMRLHAYPHHDDHVLEHHRMVETLDEIEQAHTEGESDTALAVVRSFKASLMTHIATQDTELTRFMAGT